MGFSVEWEEVYRRGQQHSVWPWSDLVSYVMRYARPNRKPYRVLELGFGAGANVSLFLSIGADYSGTDGSATAVELVRNRYSAESTVHVECCDFTQVIPFDGPFDLVVDRSSLTCNGTAAIRSCLQRVSRIIRPGGKFIGIDWFSTESSEFLTGKETEDYFTRSAFPEGHFHDIGTVHFTNQSHLMELLNEAGLVAERCEHKQTDTMLPVGYGRIAYWNFVVVKP